MCKCYVGCFCLFSHLLFSVDPTDVASLGQLSWEIPLSRNVESFEVRQKEESPLSCETSESHRAKPEGATPPSLNRSNSLGREGESVRETEKMKREREREMHS